MSTHLRTTLVLLSTIVMGCAAENTGEDPVDNGSEGTDGPDAEDEASSTGAEQALSVPCSIEVLPPRGNVGYAGAVNSYAKVRCYQSTRFTYRLCLQEYRLGGRYVTVACDASHTLSLDLYRGTQLLVGGAMGMATSTYRTRLTINGVNYYGRSAWCDT